jgi:hypothetical protein
LNEGTVITKKMLVSGVSFADSVEDRQVRFAFILEFAVKLGFGILFQNDGLLSRPTLTGQ